MTCKIEFREPEATAEEAERGATPFDTPAPWLGSTPSLIPSLGKKEGLCHKTEFHIFFSWTESSRSELFFTFWGITTHPWHPKGPRIWKLAKKICQLHPWPAEIFGKNRKMWRGQKSRGPLWKAWFSLSNPSNGPRYGFPRLKIIWV